MRPMAITVSILLLAVCIFSDDTATSSPTPNLSNGKILADGSATTVIKSLAGRAKRHAVLAERRINPPPVTENPGISTAAVSSPAELPGTGGAGPDLRLLSIWVLDSTEPGNDDGWIQPGDRADLLITLINFGNSSAQSVYGQLNPGETNPYVNIYRKSNYWSDIPAHKWADSSSAFGIEVSNALPCGYPVELSLTVQAVGYSATIPIRLDLARPYAYDLVYDTTRRYNESDAVVYGAAGLDKTGSSAAFGDFNGDGFKDLIIAAYYATGLVKPEAGKAYVIYGSSSGLPPSIDLNAPPAGVSVIAGADNYDHLGEGASVSSGDVNGDGFDDLILGAMNGCGEHNSNYDFGEVWVIYGQELPLPASIDLESPPPNATVIYGAETGDWLGYFTASGDIDNDGFDDLILAAPGGDGDGNGKSFAGEVWVIYGQAAQLSPTNLFSPPPNAKVIYGADASDFLSRVMAGDINGDSYDDLILGAIEGDGAGNTKYDAGEVWVVNGQAARLNGPLLPSTQRHRNPWCR